MALFGDRELVDDLKKKVLHRVEFVVGLVHIAILRYVATGIIFDVSDALRKLLVDDIRPQLNPKVLKPTPNVFRKAACYREDVDKVLKIFEPSLRAIFAGMCCTSGTGDTSSRKAKSPRTEVCLTVSAIVRA